MCVFVGDIDTGECEIMLLLRYGGVKEPQCPLSLSLLMLSNLK